MSSDPDLINPRKKVKALELAATQQWQALIRMIVSTTQTLINKAEPDLVHVSNSECEGSFHVQFNQVEKKIYLN